MAYLIEYSTGREVRVSDDTNETDWMDIPEDGQLLIEMGDEGHEISLYITLENYEGVMGPNTISVLRPLPSSEVTVDKDVDGACIDDTDNDADSDGDGGDDDADDADDDDEDDDDESESEEEGPEYRA
jgi:hypothetical protein